jgi:hypothetical protein
MVNVDWKWNGKGQPHTLRAPEWCRIEAWKKGGNYPTVAKVWWSEIYPNIDYAPLVRQMPRLMLAKCAKANATRTAYPSTGGLLIQEETYGKEFQFTPEGRLLAEAPNPYLDKYKEREKEGIERLTPAQKEIVERKTREAEEKKSPVVDVSPLLLYREAGDEKYEIFGPEPLFAAMDFPGKVSITVTAPGLGKIISECERRNIPIRAKE